LKFEKNCYFNLKHNSWKKTKNCGKVAEFKQIKSEIAECFHHIAVNFGSTGGRASSGPGNTDQGKLFCHL
jgi:hypothetical protein